jgi:hypothetical protein
LTAIIGLPSRRAARERLHAARGAEQMLNHVPAESIFGERAVAGELRELMRRQALPFC